MADKKPPPPAKKPPAAPAASATPPAPPEVEASMDDLPATSLLLRTRHGFTMATGPPTRPPPDGDDTPLGALRPVESFGSVGGVLGEFTTDGALFASSGQDVSTRCCCRVASRSRSRSRSPPPGPQSNHLNRAINPLLAAGGKEVELRDASSGAMIGGLGADTARVAKIAWSPKGTFLLTWQPPDKDGLPDGSLRVWAAASGAFVRAFHMKQLRREAWPGVQWSADEVQIQIQIQIQTEM